MITRATAGSHRSTLLHERRNGERERTLIELFHGEAGWMYRPDRRAPRAAAAEDCPPRLRQTLELLLHGQSEKQAARALGLSPHTVHRYVTMLYRRFDVASRAELMARFVAD